MNVASCVTSRRTGVASIWGTLGSIVELIGNMKNRIGLRVKARIDTQNCSTGFDIAKTDMHKLALRPHAFHGEWNFEMQHRNTTWQLVL